MDSISTRILFDHIPQNERTEALRSLLASLQTSDRPGLELAASLIALSTDQNIKEDFVLLLEKVIREDEVQNATSICLRYHELGLELLQKVAEHISRAKSVAHDQQPSNDAVRSYLLFAKSILSHLPVSEAHSLLFDACLDLLASEHSKVVECSKDVIFALLATTDKTVQDTVITPTQPAIWQCIQSLVTSQNNQARARLGYSLWLRWIVASEQPGFNPLVTDEYWQLLVTGLRQNDSERRKLCLNILRFTTSTDTTLGSRDLNELYQRYCTVFETIVLGRYINQIQECETDLVLLATSSALHPQWLYVLLASALDRQMQDSNRKFIGNWVMRSNLNQTPEFLCFFHNDFLTWAIQGSLFVSSLKWQNGHRRCLHGDRLSAYLKSIVAANDTRLQLTDGIVDLIISKKNYMFAYATVYLLEGLEHSLRGYHKEQLAQLTNLPEVARDFLKLRVTDSFDFCSKQNPSSQRNSAEQQAIKMIKSVKPDLDDIEAVWNDLERLDYPKSFLLAIPDVILSSSFVSHALTDPLFLENLTEKLNILLNMSITKVFLFPPFMTALRKAALSTPNVVEPLGIEGLITSIAEQPPSPTIDLMLEEATIHLTPFRYEDYFGENPSYGFATFLDLVSRLRANQTTVRNILRRILQRWKDQKVPPPTVSSWKSTLQLQVLLLCFEQVESDSREQNHSLLHDLFHILAIEPLPRYRYLLEWIIVRFLIRFDLIDVLLTRIGSKDHHSNPKHLASLMKIGTVFACRELAEERFAAQLATAFVPLAASSKVVIRHEAQWQLPVLMDHARIKGWSSIKHNPAFEVLDDYIRSLERFHDPPLERQIGRFDPGKDHTMTNLVEGPWFGLDQIGAPLTSRNDLVKLYEKETASNLPESCMPLGDDLSRSALRDDEIMPERANDVHVGPRSLNGVSALQTKGVAYLARALSDPSLHQTRSSDIIVVASFVENPYNLGGLSRVSEIFGAASLTLQNQNVVSNKDFTSVSVSSHLHFPIVQLSASDVSQFLVERKLEGFKVVGIEQTDRSLMLGTENARLPKKVVLVIGSEREGIPAIVLTECDLLVEIPQQGITRSLNVQTAVSIVMYEHARQHRKIP